MKYDRNTKETATRILSFDDFSKLNCNGVNYYVRMTCEKCGADVVKTSMALFNMIERNDPFWCGPCLRKKGCLEAHGSENWTNQEKIRATCLEKYGVDNGSKTADVKKRISEKVKKSIENGRNDKIRATNLKRYGVDNAMKRPEIQAKVRATCLERYGVEHPSQNKEIFNRMSWKSIDYDGEKFNSSWELAYWFYCKKHGIEIERNKVGYSLGNGKKVFPDFIVNGRLVEVKGDHLRSKSDWYAKNEFYERNNILVLSYELLKPIFNEVREEMQALELPVPRNYPLEEIQIKQSGRF